MDLSEKLKEARALAGITQEQAAEKLYVSRQTISNWENGKTYPDIISVVKMSDLYGVSLDRLLKDEKTAGENENATDEAAGVSDYVGYLNNSANSAKKNKKLYELILFAGYITIWISTLLLFWVGGLSENALGFSILFFMGVLPISGFSCALCIGINNLFGHYKWLSLPFFGVMVALAEYLTFSLANMIAFDKINYIGWSEIEEGLLYGMLSAALGMGIGFGVYIIKRRMRRKRSERSGCDTEGDEQ